MFGTHGGAVIMATNIAIRKQAEALADRAFTLSSRCATDALRPEIDRSIIHLTGTPVSVVLIDADMYRGTVFKKASGSTTDCSFTYRRRKYARARAQTGGCRGRC